MGAGTEKVYPDCPVNGRPVEVGGLTKSQLVRRLRELSIRLNRSAVKLFGDDRFITSDTKYALETVELTVGALGYAQGATSDDIFRRARQLGLELCPLELGPYLRMAYLDQPEGSFGTPPRRHQAPAGSVTIASEPLDEDRDTPKGFYLRRIDGILWLRGYVADATHIWNPGDHLVFYLPGRSPLR